MHYYPWESNAAGVTPISGQNTDPAAAEAVQPQKGGDELNPKPSPDVDLLIAELDALEKECTAICDKLYMGKQPTWVEREKLHDRLNEVDKAKAAIRYQLSQTYEGMA